MTVRSSQKESKTTCSLNFNPWLMRVCVCVCGGGGGWGGALPDKSEGDSCHLTSW